MYSYSIISFILIFLNFLHISFKKTTVLTYWNNYWDTGRRLCWCILTSDYWQYPSLTWPRTWLVYRAVYYRLTTPNLLCVSFGQGQNYHHISPDSSLGTNMAAQHLFNPTVFVHFVFGCTTILFGWSFVWSSYIIPDKYSSCVTS